MGELTIIGPEGTERLTWDPMNPEETGSIQNRFDQLLEKGYSAFRLVEAGGESRKVSCFDVLAQKMIMVPKLGGG